MINGEYVLLEVVKSVSFLVEGYLGSIYDSLNNRGIAGRRLRLAPKEYAELQEVLEAHIGEEKLYYLNRSRELDYVRLESVCKDIVTLLYDSEEDLDDHYGGTWIGLAIEDITFLTGEIHRAVSSVCDLVMVLDPATFRKYNVNIVQGILSEVKIGGSGW